MNVCMTMVRVNILAHVKADIPMIAAWFEFCFVRWDACAGTVSVDGRYQMKPIQQAADEMVSASRISPMSGNILEGFDNIMANMPGNARDIRFSGSFLFY